MRRSLFVMFVVVGCADPAPAATSTAATFACGSIVVDLRADHRAGCPVSDWHRESVAETVALREGGAGYDNAVELDANQATLHASCVAAPAGPSVTGTLAFRSRADRVCGFGCEGGAASARFRWAGTLTVPSPASAWRARVVADTVIDTARGPKAVGAVCTIETPWRAPIVVDAPHLERELQATEGAATVRVECHPDEPQGFTSLACIGAPNPPRPDETSPEWFVRTLTVRFELSRL